MCVGPKGRGKSGQDQRGGERLEETLCLPRVHIPQPEKLDPAMKNPGVIRSLP